MVYCTASEVRTIINTSLSDTEITLHIELSDAEINRRIGAQSTGDQLVKKLSLLLTAHTIKTRQPKSTAVGEYRDDSGNVLEVWESEIERIYRLYESPSVVSSGYQHIDEELRYTQSVSQTGAQSTLIRGVQLAGATTYVGFDEEKAEYFSNYYWCDGDEDDIQIQAAIDSTVRIGGLVLCERGTYDIKATVESYAGIGLVGVQPGLHDTPATHFKADPTLDAPVIKLLVHPSYLGDKYFPYLSGIYVEGNNDPSKTSNHGVHVSNENGPFADGYIDHVWAMKCGGNGFHIHDGKTYLADVYPESNQGHGIYCEGQTLLDVSRAYVFGNMKNGLYLNSLITRCSVRDSWIIYNVLDGLWANNFTGDGALNVDGCDFDGNQRDNIRLGDVANLHITNCFLRDTHGSVVTDKHINIYETCMGLIEQNTFRDLTNPDIISLPGNAIDLQIRGNLGFNPYGNIANPFDNINNLAGLPAGGSSTPLASTDYTVRGVDCFLTVTGGTGVSITLKDPSGSTFASGLADLTAKWLPRGFRINFGAFTVAPSTTVCGN